MSPTTDAPPLRRPVRALRGPGSTLAFVGGCLVLAAPASAWAAKKLYRWVDAQGYVHYGDSVPAQAAAQGRETLDTSGRVTARTAREATSAERAAASARAAAAAAEARTAAEQARYDSLLVQTYDTEAALAAARDERLAALDTRLALARRADAAAEQVTTDLKARLARQPGNEKLAAQIAARARIDADNRHAMTAMQAERQRLVDRFDDDLVRYRRLKSSPAGRP